MERIRRNERMSAMMKLLSDAPNKIHTLSTFCELFSAAKSTMSEDVDILSDAVKAFGLGELETVTGAAGGVRYRPIVPAEKAYSFVNSLCETLSDRGRVLAGGFLYYSDILSDPETVRRMGEILAGPYYDNAPDFVLTMETKGIPVALETARALGVPLVIARHASKAYEGSAVNISYVSGTSKTIENMSLARRAVQPGQKALIVDDFLKGGGTANGMVELMREFDVQVIGLAFVMATAVPEKKRVQGERSLMTLRLDADSAIAEVKPSAWLREAAEA